MTLIYTIIWIVILITLVQISKLIRRRMQNRWDKE